MNMALILWNIRAHLPIQSQKYTATGGLTGDGVGMFDGGGVQYRYVILSVYKIPL